MVGDLDDIAAQPGSDGDAARRSLRVAVHTEAMQAFTGTLVQALPALSR